MIKVAIISAMMIQSVFAEQPYVDIYDSKDPKNVVIEVIINECVTTFKIPKDKWISFTTSDSHMNELVQIAKEKSAGGCQSPSPDTK